MNNYIIFVIKLLRIYIRFEKYIRLDLLRNIVKRPHLNNKLN